MLEIIRLTDTSNAVFCHKAEGYFNSRSVYAHSEFTTQQTMRGKMALYGYLCGLYKAHTQAYSMSINISNGTVSKSPDKTFYNYGDTVTITAVPDPNYRFKNWTGDASGTSNPVKIAMNSNKNITANFDSTTGIQLPKTSTIGIYPNPASDIFYIKMAEGAGVSNL
jgi:uncharacterized repeat protein (TIGR02543 family)